MEFVQHRSKSRETDDSVGGSVAIELCFLSFDCVNRRCRVTKFGPKHGALSSWSVCHPVQHNRARR